jgi:integrase
VRRSDVVELGPQHVSAGKISVRPQKTQGTTNKRLKIPLHRDLAAAIAATPTGHLAFLTTAHGRQFTAAGFGNWFRDQVDAAGLPARCAAHGLRKAAASRLADAGATAHMIQAVTGHATLAEVQRYTLAADQERLAEEAIRTVEERGVSNRGERLDNSGGK